METAISLFQKYSGQGMIVSLFIISLVYLWFVEKKKEKRRLLVYFPLGLLALFFCPLLMLLVEKLGEEEVYWRILWSIPMIAVIAYAAIVLIRNLEGMKRYLAIIGVLILIMVSGNYLYDNPGFLKADNPEHIPEEVVEICDSIIVEGREVMAAFPAELLMYVPQYTALVQMPYGREVFLRPDGIIITHELYELMDAKEIEAKVLAETLRKYQCHFVVLGGDTILDGELERENWLLYGETDGYRIYIDNSNDPRYW